ncbi:GNAT family N-acetyltransferase [Methylobacterium sp. J-026]|uniref:GNAT family N-acetyltransferase n=1 Tax=Methylobacterium sp. J-026 TaxID=2836624 RepID=UPI001FB9E844|nr:GNAT family N-acetyltransferase [Methylobacterium sp. J-026]MCJ2135367.1 GNAT family N-acetyltransferase [Methylobacterium sp. J-026]
MQGTEGTANSAPPYIIRTIQKGDCKLPFALAGKQHESLKIYFRKDSERARRELITQTYVAVPKNSIISCILGYISLMSAEIAFAGTYSIPDKPRADRYPTQPAIRIARLAVADGARGCGVGRDLLSLSISIAIDHVCASVGCRFLITNAKPESVGFYGKYGFALLDTDENRASIAPIMWLDLRPYVATIGG